VVDQAYFEYIVDADYPDAVEEYVKRGRHAVVLRTFSKIYGLAGARVGYAVAAADICAAMAKTRRPFDITTQAQVAAVASLDDPEELARRRAQNAEGRDELAATLRENGLNPALGPVGNFLYVDLGEDAQSLYERLLREAVIVRPLHGFGAPNAIRVSVGSPEENAFFGEALPRALEGR
jgi:histidinol-phosphate aminotransferase